MSDENAKILFLLFYIIILFALSFWNASQINDNKMRIEFLEQTVESGMENKVLD